MDRVREAPDEDERRRHDHFGGVVYAGVVRVLLGHRHRHHTCRIDVNVMHREVNRSPNCTYIVSKFDVKYQMTASQQLALRIKNKKTFESNANGPACREMWTEWQKL